MADVKTFREKVTEYLRQGKDEHEERPTQADLAAAIGLNKDELSKRLNQYSRDSRKWELTSTDVLLIVQVLARWRAITLQEQAEELFSLMDYPLLIDWAQDDLHRLQPAKSHSLPPFALRQKYLEKIVTDNALVNIPPGLLGGITVPIQDIFQPLKLQRDPHIVTDLSPSQRRLILGEPLSPTQAHRQSRQSSAKDGWDALSKSSHHRMIVLGQPGAGKTLLLQYITYTAAIKALAEKKARLPIFIRATHFHTSAQPEMALIQVLKDIAGTVEENAQDTNFLWSAYTQGNTILCIDGLDEVMNKQFDSINYRQEFLQIITALVTSSARDNFWVLSSRYASYPAQGQKMREWTTEWELLPLTEPLQRKLARQLIPVLWKHFLPTRPKNAVSRQASEPSTRKEKAVVFLEQLAAYPRWGENPLLFSLAAEVYASTGFLPTNRSELYRRSTLNTLSMRDVAPEELVRPLSALALELFLKGIGRVFTFNDLLNLVADICKDQGLDAQNIRQRLIHCGLLDLVAQETYGFLHQTFQEYLAAAYIADLPMSQAIIRCSRLLDKADEPPIRQIFFELASLLHERTLSPDMQKRAQRPLMEEDLYQQLVAFWGYIKVQIEEEKRKGTKVSAHSPVANGISLIVEDLRELWGEHLYETLREGSADREEDVQVASSIGYILTKYQVPSATAIATLVECLHKYPKKGRFVEALGEIGTPEALAVLLDFLRETFEQSSDTYLFQSLAETLYKTAAPEALSLAQTLFPQPGWSTEVLAAAQRALYTLEFGPPFDEQTIRAALKVSDDLGRDADWRGITRICDQLQHHGIHDPIVQAHLSEIVTALENVLVAHRVDYAREAAAQTLGTLGNAPTFALMLTRLEGKEEPAGAVATAMLAALCQLAARGEIAHLPRPSLAKRMRTIQTHYPLLVDDIQKVETCLNDTAAMKESDHNSHS